MNQPRLALSSAAFRCGAGACGLIAAALSAIALAGRLLRLDALAGLPSSLLAIKAATAVSFTLLGISLFLATLGTASSPRSALVVGVSRRVLAGAVALSGAATLLFVRARPRFRDQSPPRVGLPRLQRPVRLAVCDRQRLDIHAARSRFRARSRARTAARPRRRSRPRGPRPRRALGPRARGSPPPELGRSPERTDATQDRRDFRPLGTRPRPRSRARPHRPAAGPFDRGQHRSQASARGLLCADHRRLLPGLRLSTGILRAFLRARVFDCLRYPDRRPCRLELPVGRARGPGRPARRGLGRGRPARERADDEAFRGKQPGLHRDVRSRHALPAGEQALARELPSGESRPHRPVPRVGGPRGPDAVHHRGDEVDERNRGRVLGHGGRSLRPERKSVEYGEKLFRIKKA